MVNEHYRSNIHSFRISNVLITYHRVGMNLWINTFKLYYTLMQRYLQTFRQPTTRSSRRYLHLARGFHQEELDALPPVLDVLGVLAPHLSVLGLRGDAALLDVLLLLLAAVAQLELVEVDPGVAHVGVELDGAGEPLAALLHLPLGPEEPRHGEQHVGLVVALGEGVDGALLAPRLRLHEDALRPEHARRGALLQRAREQRVGLLRRPVLQLDAHRRQPQLLVPRVLEAALLDERARLRHVPPLQLELRGQAPQRHAERAPLHRRAPRRPRLLRAT